MIIEDAKKNAIDLYWLAFLLTGRQDLSIDIAVDAAVLQDHSFFRSWMSAWARRLAIAKALTAIRDELAESARRTKRPRADQWAVPPRDWSLRPGATKANIEEALLAIDVFPRAAVLLSIFEGVRVPDAAILLDADPTLVRKAQAIGLRELTANLARKKSRVVPGFPALAFVRATH